MDIPYIDWLQISANLASIALAYALALPLAWDRETQDRSAGLRTFPIVAIASCGYMLFAVKLFPESPDAQARLIQGLIVGIGFIGGGAILKGQGNVHGTATAASIWNTGAIGAAVAYGRYEIAIVLSVTNFITLRLLTPLEKKLRDDGPKKQS